MNINISDETYNFLKNIVSEIETQDNRCTRLPILFIIKETIKEYGIEEDYGADGYIWIREGNSDEGEWQWSEIVEHIRGAYESDYFNPTEEDAIDNGFRKIFYRNIERISDNFFFTGKACKKHLEINGHNLISPQDWVIYPFRNPEVEGVVNAMKEIISQAEVNNEIISTFS